MSKKGGGDATVLCTPMSDKNTFRNHEYMYMVSQRDARFSTLKKNILDLISDDKER